MRRKKKRRIISLTLIVIAIILILGCIGYLLISSNQNKVDNKSIEKINASDVEKSVETNKTENNKELKSVKDDTSSKTLFDKFLSGEIDATAINEFEDTEYTLNVSELDIDGGEWDSSSIYGYLDVDNDGEDELVITNAYGASLFDAKDGKVTMFASGGGTGNTLLFAYYEDAYWVVYAYAGADCDAFSMYKYKGADSIEETFYFGCETDENGNERYYKKGNESEKDIEISQEEYKKFADSIIQLN